MSVTAVEAGAALDGLEPSPHGSSDALMAEYTFPLRSAMPFVQRVDSAPAGARVRRWVIRDDNQQHHHGAVPLEEEPAYVELLWKGTARGREQLVGVFRLDLARLLKDGYVRRERDDESNEIRLRFHRGDRSVVYIQAQVDGPALPIGVIDATLG